MQVEATPFVQNESTVQIYPGETIFLEAIEKEGKLSLKSVRAVKDPSKTITISCTQNVSNGKHENVMVNVKNPFDRVLTYSARMLLLNTDKWVVTDVWPVQPKIFGIEMWQDVVISFELADWKLADK